MSEPKKFIVKIEATFMATDIDDAMEFLGKHFLNPDDENYQFLAEDYSSIEVHPIEEEDHA